MGKPETKAEKLLDAATTRWRDRLWMKQHDLTVRFADGKLTKNVNVSGIAAAEMDATPRYKEMTITVSKEWLEGSNPSEIDDVVCHEMVHAVLGPLKDVASAMLKALPPSQRKGFYQFLDKENEAVTTHLEHILRREARWPKR